MLANYLQKIADTAVVAIPANKTLIASNQSENDELQLFAVQVAQMLTALAHPRPCLTARRRRNDICNSALGSYSQDAQASLKIDNQITFTLIVFMMMMKNVK